MPILPKISCCAVVVTYHPEDALVDAVRLLAGQVERVVVVDNASGEEYEPLLAAVGHQDTCVVIRNCANLGIGAGFNAGIRYALQAGYDWVATFDQDSRIPEGYFTALLTSLQACPDAERVALVAPRLRDPVTGLAGSHGGNARGALYEEVPVTISSGSLLRCALFAHVGLFDEELFMDYVDHEYCLRLRKAGFILLESTIAVLEHRIGATSRHAILGMSVKVTNHSPLRRYYMTRNRLVLYRKYGARFTAWAVNDAWCMLKELLGIALFERQRAEKFGMVALGIKHAIAGRLGSLHEERLKREEEKPTCRRS